MQYKTVAGPVGLTINKKDSYTEAVRQYADIIQREATGGWRLVLIQEIPVVKKNGVLQGYSATAPLRSLSICWFLNGKAEL